MTTEQRTVNFLLNGEIADTVKVILNICEDGTELAIENSVIINDVMNRVFMEEHGWENKLRDHPDDTIRVTLADKEEQI